MRPLVGLDVDGVLLDFRSRWMIEYEKMREEDARAIERASIRVRQYISNSARTKELANKEKLPAIDLQDHVTWDLFGLIKDDGARKELVQRCCRPTFCESIPLHDGVKEGFSSLQEVADIVIVTAPFHGSSTWTHERDASLAHHLGIHPSDILHVTKKEHVSVDFFVDDKVENVARWIERQRAIRKRHPEAKKSKFSSTRIVPQAASLGGIIWDQPWNRGKEDKVTEKKLDLLRLCSWNDLVQIAKDWADAH